MHIKRLEIYGFKSFPYKTVIPFEKGITAIVGPNGSGKSNILDAIKWVLGEQSPKRLRVKELSDLIYSGNTDRKIDFAEVKIVLNHDPPILDKFKENHELIVIRRFYKDGESEFIINNRQCRLKDIQFLFLNLGINYNSYGIIDQGEITKFLEINPVERRYYLEELAGVAKLRLTQDDIIKKIKATEHNLERLSDILKEVEIQYLSLKEQAEVAKKYLNLRDSFIETKKKYLFIKQKEILKRKKEKEEEKENAILKFKKIEDEIQYIEIEERKILSNISILERKKNDLGKEKDKVENEIRNILTESNKIEKELLLTNEKINNYKSIYEIEKNRKNSLLKEIEKIEREIIEIEKNKEALLKRLKEIRENLQKKEIEFNNLQKSFGTKKKEIDDINREIIKLKEKRESLLREIKKIDEDIKKMEYEMKEKRRLLDKINTDLENHKKTLEKIDRELEDENEFLKKIKEEFEKLKLVTNNLKDKKNELKNILYSLKEREKLIRKILSSFKKNLPIELQGKILGNYLLKFINDLKYYETFYREYINAVIIEDIQEVYNLTEEYNLEVFTLKNNLDKLILNIEHSEKTLKELFLNFNFNHDIIYITKDSFLVAYNKFIVKINEENKGFFSLQKELQEIEKQKNYQIEFLKEIEVSYDNKTKELREIEEKVKELELSIKEKNEKKEQITKNLLILGQKKEFLEKNKNDEIKKLDSLQRNREIIQREISKIESELANISDKHKILNKEFQYLKENLAKLEKERKQILDELNKLERELLLKENDLQYLNKKKTEIEKEILKIENFLQEVIINNNKLESEERYLTEKLEKKKKELNELKEKQNGLKNDILKIESEINNLNEKIKKVSFDKKSKERELRNLEKLIHNTEIDLTEINLTLQNLQKEFNQLSNKNSLDNDIDTSEDVNTLEKKLEELENQLKNFNDVNLASIKEFEKIKVRYEELNSQKIDIEKSLLELKHILSDLEAEARDRMLKCLDIVNKNLIEIFPILFENSQAHLSFTGDDPLNSGLDLTIRVPYKNIRNIYMLSGGEKALCVIGLLLAFYLTKPGPFCILDEIDAPLDEKNSQKFIKLLSKIKEKSQIILISHNPHVIKEVDNIIGVTMEEKGVSKIIKIDFKSS